MAFRLATMDSFPGLLLTLIAISGEFPTCLIDRLQFNSGYMESVITRLKQEKLVRTFYRNGLRGLRLTAAAKKLLLEKYPERFQSSLTGVSEINRPKCEVPRRLRLHYLAEVLTTMFNSGVSVFSWEKPAIFRPDSPLSNCRVDRPAYYSSREIKETGLSSNKIRNSRAVGVLLADNAVYTIYNMGPYQMKWEYKAEMRFKVFMQMEVCQTRLPAQFAGADQCAVVFGEGMDQLDTLLGVGDGLSHNHFILDGSYDHF